MKFISTVFLVFLLGTASAQVLVRNVVPVDYNTLEYPNLTGNTTSTQPFKGSITRKDGTTIRGKVTFFKKKSVFEKVKVKTETDKVEIPASEILSISLDPKVYEAKYANNFKNPEKNFQTGYVVLPGGEKLRGKVAQVRDLSDYDFFIYTVMFLPEGSEVASSLQGGKLLEFGQEINGTLHIWDGYADGYLRRMVDGRFRLSRNPYSKTQNEFFTSLKNRATDSLSKQAAQQSMVQGIKSGKDINESIESAASAAATVAEAMGSVQINKKEYLIFDTRTNTVTSVNKDNLKSQATALGAGCGVSADAVSWDKMEEFVKELNAACK